VVYTVHGREVERKTNATTRVLVNTSRDRGISFHNFDGKEHNNPISRDTYVSSMNTSDTDKAQFGPRTMVDAVRTRGNQASNALRDRVIFDSFILLQSKGILHKAIAEHNNVNHM